MKENVRSCIWCDVIEHATQADSSSSRSLFCAMRIYFSQYIGEGSSFGARCYWNHWHKIGNVARKRDNSVDEAMYFFHFSPTRQIHLLIRVTYLFELNAMRCGNGEIPNQYWAHHWLRDRSSRAAAQCTMLVAVAHTNGKAPHVLTNNFWNLKYKASVSTMNARCAHANTHVLSL